MTVANPNTGRDWKKIGKWGAIGVGGLALLCLCGLVSLAAGGGATWLLTRNSVAAAVVPQVTVAPTPAPVIVVTATPRPAQLEVEHVYERNRAWLAELKKLPEAQTVGGLIKLLNEEWHTSANALEWLEGGQTLPVNTVFWTNFKSQSLPAGVEKVLADGTWGIFLTTQDKVKVDTPGRAVELVETEK